MCATRPPPRGSLSVGVPSQLLQQIAERGEVLRLTDGFAHTLAETLQFYDPTFTRPYQGLCAEYIFINWEHSAQQKYSSRVQHDHPRGSLLAGVPSQLLQQIAAREEVLQLTVGFGAAHTLVRG
ncbi:hypothetical protein CDAR_64871 [Caerostris darwini]|uniref:Uncharacterized protein n=1 Tax=Caerostris darwini TaxID=1538125 RepID=A0AAV4T6N2_9ARAC|nr:hypothetical protein CDAR_64871 [Caerostris darwini]